MFSPTLPWWSPRSPAQGRGASSSDFLFADNSSRTGSSTDSAFFSQVTDRCCEPATLFELVSTKAMPSGIILSFYRVAGPLKTG